MGGWNELWQMLDGRPESLWDETKPPRMMTNPKYQKLYNVAHRRPRQLLTESPLLYSIIVSIPASPCQFLLLGVSSHQPLTIKLSLMITHHLAVILSLHAPYQDKAQSQPIRGRMKLTNQRPENCLHGLVILWIWKEKNDDTLICQCTFRLCLSSPPGLIGLWANSKLNFNF